MEPEDSTGDLRPLQAQGAQVGQALLAVLDQGLKAYPLRDLPELPRGRYHPIIIGQYQRSQAAEAAVLTKIFQGANYLKLGDLAASEGALDGCDRIEYRDTFLIAFQYCSLLYSTVLHSYGGSQYSCIIRVVPKTHRRSQYALGDVEAA